MTLVGMVGFGLSVSLYMAIVTRLFVGLSAGIVGTCKTIASEASDNTNQALAMSVLLTSWNVGLIIGPAIGGYLAEPSLKYPTVFTQDSLFDRFPFFLPCLLNCAALLISIVLAYFYLPETLVKSDGENSSSSSETGELAMQSTASISLIDGDDEKGSLQKNSLEETEEVEIFIGDVHKENIEDDINCCGFKSCCCPRHRCCKFFRDSNIAVLLRDRVVALVICVYCALSFVVIGYDELFSLWAATGSELGGLGFSTDQIGTALLCVAGPMLLLQLWVYPKLERRLGSIRVFQLANVVMGISIASLAALNTLHDRLVPKE
ncbi:putative peptide/nitrate transporter [Stylophora pistillata]|uniref:Putative peptide/nitrate transporter n=2 Tax=Stylophora pistillata TaxID=50429 RepID=A0A2B4RWQ7_STYPI|nr:putative peptide/nitrate transporter [Stylophora pistillata]